MFRNIPIKLLLIPTLVGLIFATPLPAQAEGEQAPLTHRQARLADLNLTPEQQQQIRQIRQNARAQIQQVLTPQQRQQLSQLRNQDPKQRRAAMKQLNLTEAQKAQIRQIRAQTRQQIKAILTPEQRQQLAAWRQQRQKWRGQPTNP